MDNFSSKPTFVLNNDACVQTIEDLGRSFMAGLQKQ